jgi:6-pyruvoyltetrahydropterin/6-carboxytetrahydropterin synthase
MVSLTFVCEVNAVHRLWNSRLGDRENLEIFGECANPAGHGHLYRVEVTCEADVTSGRPTVLGRGAVDRIAGVLKERLQNASMDTVFNIDDFISTGENVTREIWRLVEPHVPADARLVSVNVVETPKNSFTYAGDGESHAHTAPQR